jgi:hypothetical protein
MSRNGTLRIEGAVGMSYVMRGRVAVTGVGEAKYYKHRQSPHAEFKLALPFSLLHYAERRVDRKS